MGIAYNLFEFLHIAAAMVWLGGLVTMTILNARLGSGADSAALTAITNYSRFFSTRVVGPAAGVTLLAGIILIFIGGVGLPLWVIWGLAMMGASMALGGTLFRRAGEELSERVRTAEQGDSRVIELRRHLRNLNIINLLLLFSAVWAMVFKPTL
jgi:uncharacterized membrane protein